MKKCVIVGTVFLLTLYMGAVQSCAENDNGLSTDVINRRTKSQYNTELTIEEVFHRFQNGTIVSMIKEKTKQKLISIFINEIKLKELFVQMLVIGIFLSLIRNFSKSFLEQYIGTTGFYIGYIILTGVMVRQFLIIYQLANDGLTDIVTFMKLMIPTYCTALVAVSGVSTSIASYELFFLLITGVQWGILHIVFPAIKINFVLKLLNFLVEEDLFSGFIDLLEDGIRLLLKGSIMIVLLFNIFQSMLLPAVDSVKSNVIQKGINALPGIGQVFGMLANTAIGSGVILKNTIGVFGMLVICSIGLAPVIRIFLYTGSFQLAGAVIQPVTNKQIYEIFKQVSISGRLLLQAFLTSVVLFLVTIAIVSMSTNMNYYVG